MFTAIAIIVILSVIGYLVQRGFTGQPFNPRMAGSVPFEDRDVARIAHDLVR